MKKIFAILLAVSAMAFVLNGCSGGGDAEKPADAPAAPAADAGGEK